VFLVYGRKEEQGREATVCAEVLSPFFFFSGTYNGFLPPGASLCRSY
jgi:hypothetical protein